MGDILTRNFPMLCDGISSYEGPLAKYATTFFGVRRIRLGAVGGAGFHMRQDCCKATSLGSYPVSSDPSRAAGLQRGMEMLKTEILWL